MPVANPRSKSCFICMYKAAKCQARALKAIFIKFNIHSAQEAQSLVLSPPNEMVCLKIYQFFKHFCLFIRTFLTVILFLRHLCWSDI